MVRLLVYLDWAQIHSLDVVTDINTVDIPCKALGVSKYQELRNTHSLFLHYIASFVATGIHEDKDEFEPLYEIKT